MNKADRIKDFTPTSTYLGVQELKHTRMHLEEGFRNSQLNLSQILNYDAKRKIG